MKLSPLNLFRANFYHQKREEDCNKLHEHHGRVSSPHRRRPIFQTRDQRSLFSAR